MKSPEMADLIINTGKSRTRVGKLILNGKTYCIHRGQFRLEVSGDGSVSIRGFGTGKVEDCIVPKWRETQR